MTNNQRYQRLHASNEMELFLEKYRRASRETRPYFDTSAQTAAGTAKQVLK
jgi:hypothetical protein